IPSRGSDSFEFAFGARLISLGNSLAERAGVNLNHGRAEALRGRHLPQIRIDEERHAHAGFAQLAHERGDVIVLASDVEAAFGGALLASLRHQAYSVRLHLERN